jgi:hypothetical protein
MTTSEKVAYLKGLAEGLGVDKETKEGRILDAILDILEDVAHDIEDLEENAWELGEAIDQVSDDLSDIEDIVYDLDEDEDDDENLDFGSIATLEDLSWKTALGIGCFQVLSLVPGTSRSGSTIIGGLLLGCTRSVASKFTFFLAIPVMFGASALKLVKYFIKGGTFGANEVAILGVGCVVAFVVSLIAIKWLMGFVRRHDFKCFGVYRIILGIVVLAYFFVLEPMLGL